MKKQYLRIRMVTLAVGVIATIAFIYNSRTMPDNHPLSTDGARASLSPEAYRVMYEQSTEVAFSSPLYAEHRSGTYVTADTGLPVYRSEDKYDSGTGWPSFTKPIDGSVMLREDDSLFAKRTEVVSKDTGAHLGHVFDDGPADRGGKRYCMNGVALRFIPDEAQ